MKAIKMAIAVFLFLTILYQPAFAKDNTAKKSINNSKPFDISLTHLPPQYSGNNPAAVYGKVKHELVEKNEFETNEEYQTRVNKARESLGLYAFLRLQDSEFSDEYEKVSYDAEAEAFIVTIPVIGGLDSVVYLTRYSGEKGSYIGQNAFGAKVRVSKRDATRYIVRFSSDLEPLSKFSLKVPMPRPEAKRLKDSIRVLYIGSPLHATRDTTRWTPEIKDPYDTNVVIYSIEMQLKQIWIYNYKTGQILTKKTSQPEPK